MGGSYVDVSIESENKDDLSTPCEHLVTDLLLTFFKFWPRISQSGCIQALSFNFFMRINNFQASLKVVSNIWSFQPLKC